MGRGPTTRRPSVTSSSRHTLYFYQIAKHGIYYGLKHMKYMPWFKLCSG